MLLMFEYVLIVLFHWVVFNNIASLFLPKTLPISCDFGLPLDNLDPLCQISSQELMKQYLKSVVQLFTITYPLILVTFNLIYLIFKKKPLMLRLKVLHKKAS
jgi:hypothetical protein